MIDRGGQNVSMIEEAQRDQLLNLIAADQTAMELLRLARSLALPDWAIGAGFLLPEHRPQLLAGAEAFDFPG